MSDKELETEEEVVTPEATETETPEAQETETPAVEEQEEQDEDVLGMSDEDFLKEEETRLAEEAAADTEDEPDADETASTEEETPADPAVEVKDPAEGATTPAEPVDPGSPTKAAPLDPEASAQPKEIDETLKAKPGGLIDPLTVDDATAVAAYKEIFKPFKANGKDIQVRNTSEAIRLMQMGANYTKSMQRLKPAMTMLKTLERANVGTEDLNYLIELRNKNPEAIKKLVRESGIDPIDIDMGEDARAADKNYRPKDYRVSETQVNFEMAVEEVNSQPGGREVLESVRTEWDGDSREALLQDPSILHTLTQHHQGGYYSQIVDQMEHERTLGHLNGVSFLEAYQAIGKIMTEQSLFRGPAAPVNTDPVDPVVTTPSEPGKTPSPTVTDPVVLERKAAIPKSKAIEDRRVAAAAAPAPSKPGKVLPKNPLAMSDEDFEKIEGMGHLT